MVVCEYSLKEIPKGEKRLKYYYIVMGDKDTIHPEGIDAHIEKNCQGILVSKETAKKLFGYAKGKGKKSGIKKITK